MNLVGGAVLSNRREYRQLLRMAKHRGALIPSDRRLTQSPQIVIQLQGRTSGETLRIRGQNGGESSGTQRRRANGRRSLCGEHIVGNERSRGAGAVCSRHDLPPASFSSFRFSCCIALVNVAEHALAPTAVDGIRALILRFPCTRRPNRRSSRTCPL